MRYTLITGASSGIGLSLAKKFAGKGHKLILVARRVDRLKKISEKLRERYGIDCIYIEADLSLAKGLKSFIHSLEEYDIGLLINCAGILKVDKAWDIELKDDISMIYTNLISPIELSKYCAKAWIKAGKKGRIINIVSLAAECPHAYMSTYSATKAGLYHYSIAMGAELRHRGVKILTVCPGPTDTPLIRSDVISYPKGDVDRLSDDIVNAYDSGRMVLISNLLYKSLTIISKILPESLRVLIIAKIMELRVKY